ncbi:unnamed protein product, partial [Adineta steineri]
MKIYNLVRYIPHRYRIYLFTILIICSFYFIYLNRSISSDVKITNDYVNDFDLFDDDDMSFICPSEIQFFIANRQHLVVIIASKLESYVWINFRTLLCSGVDVYVMLNEVFPIDSRTNRSICSYSHRFLYVKNQHLEKFDVKYTKKLSNIKYTSWDRAIVWLYHRINFENVWIIEHDIQWFDVRHMTYLFDRFINDRTDLLCNGIISRNSQWSLWPHAESDIFPYESWHGTFSPLVRWSRRLLQHHYRYMQLIHRNRLKYEIYKDFRYQEFIMGTIARIENLSIETYSNNNSLIYFVSDTMNDRKILHHLRHG